MLRRLFWVSYFCYTVWYDVIIAINENDFLGSLENHRTKKGDLTKEVREIGQCANEDAGEQGGWIVIVRFHIGRRGEQNIIY